MPSPKLHGICLVKNEDDIISQTLVYALGHCDKIFVVDNGSTDETWTIVKYLSEEYKQIVPLLQTDESFSNGLRALVYNKYHLEFSPDDWWLVLDGDEFLAEDPRPLIQQAMSDEAEVIRSWQIHFFFTDADYEQWLKGRDSRATPIFSRRRYYIIDWQENRLFRNDPERTWDPQRNSWYPQHLKTFSKRLILNRHYQFRDPEQIQKRLLLRFGSSLFPHVNSADWRSVIVPYKRLSYYREGEAWRFTVQGLARYYGKYLHSLCREVARRVCRFQKQ